MKMKTKKIKFILLIGCVLCLSGCSLSAFQTVALGSGLIQSPGSGLFGMELERQYNENKK
jgi:hypothetical protein